MERHMATPGLVAGPTPGLRGRVGEPSVRREHREIAGRILEACALAVDGTGDSVVGLEKVFL